jgi:Cu/Ag efflux pump CusA
MRKRQVGSDVRAEPATVMAACLRNRAGLGFVLLAVLVAVVPLLVMGPLTVAFTRSLVAAYAVALVAAALVAMVVTPTLAVLLLRGAPADLREGVIVRLARRQYERRAAQGGARGWTRSPRLAWAVCGILTVACLLAVPQLSQRSLLPAIQDRNLLVHLDALAGTSLTEMDRVTNAVAGELRRVPGVGDVGAHVGRAVTSDQDVDVASAEIWLQVEDQADYAATAAAVGAVVRAYPGVRGSLVKSRKSPITGAISAHMANMALRNGGVARWKE